MHVRMSAILVFVTLSVALISNAVAADFKIHQTPNGKFSFTDIELTGLIAPGDETQFKSIYGPIAKTFKDIGDEQSIRIFLNSAGGSYVEGLLLGRFFHQSGLATYVRAGDACFSACAMAFLGGTFLGTSGGWGPSRHLELGSRLGFHSFYYAGHANGLLPAEGIDMGKVLTLLAVGYAAELEIDMQFVIDSLNTHSDDILLVNTAGLLGSLKIKTTGIAPQQRVPDEAAVNLCNSATDWKRPVNTRGISTSPDPLTRRGGTAPAVIGHMTAKDLMHHMMEVLVAADYLRGPITDLVRGALKNGNPEAIARIFGDLDKLEILPSLNGAGRIIHVSGFEYGHGFWVSDCYVVPHNEGTSNLSVDAILQSAQMGRSFETKKFSMEGTVIYGLSNPNEVLLRNTH